ncbi:MAG: DMT family transporter [Anaerovoracaceae bacterium]
MKIRVYVGIGLTAFLFGTMEVALKIGGSDLDPFQLTFLRFLIGGIVILPLAIKELRDNKIKLTINQFFYLTMVGIVCIPISMLLFQLGILNCNAATASVLISINPLFTMIFAHYFANERMTKVKGLAIIFGLIGTIFMIKPWNLQEGNSVLGIILMLLASLTFGIYTVMGKKSTKEIGIMAQTSISFIMGAVVLLIIIVAMGKPVFEGVGDHLVLVSYVGIFVTGLGYLSYFVAIKYSDATTGSIAFFIKPAIAPFMAVIFLGEHIMWNTYVGIGFVLIASYVNLKESKKINGSDR